MTTATKTRIQDIIQEFNPQRCDVDIVLTARSFEDAHAGTAGTSLLARWNGREWSNYDMGSQTSCLLVHEGQLYSAVAKGYETPTRTYALVNAADHKSLVERPFMIRAAAVTKEAEGEELTDIVHEGGMWLKFKTKSNVLDRWMYSIKSTPGNTLIPTPDGYYIHDSYTLQKMFGARQFKVPEGMQLGTVAYAGQEEIGHNHIFIARTYHAEKRDLNFAKIFMSGMGSDISPHCVIPKLGDAGAYLLYARNEGRTLYFLTGVNQRIMRVDVGDSMKAEAKEVLKLDKDHFVEYFKIFPHGEITHNKLD